ncbi:MAG: ATP-binding protein [Candidatus Hodarchaeales archaeon]|jgi:signal transduction histidine kinase
MLEDNLIRKNTFNDVIKVLLLEDSLDDILLIQEILTHTQSNTMKFELKSTYNLLTGLMILRNENFHAILLDLSLPDAAKLEAFDKINSLFPHIPIIVLTGLDDENLAIKAVRSGAQDYLVKGTVDGTLLTHSIRYAIERKKATNVLKELEHRRTNFIDMVSHELRTPLTVIRGYLEFLDRYSGSLPPEKLSDCLKPMHRGVIRLEQLIKGVNDLAEIDKGIFALNGITNISICDFLFEVLIPHSIRLHDQLDINNINNFDETNEDQIKGDSLRLQQVIDNLIENAIRNSSDENRKIKCVVEIISDKVRIIVEDNGAGVHSSNIESIFEQFISIPTKYYAGGTGIGLYISRKIAQAHGGTLVAQSEGEGKGSKFILELPRES